VAKGFGTRVIQGTSSLSCEHSFVFRVQSDIKYVCSSSTAFKCISFTYVNCVSNRMCPRICPDQIEPGTLGTL
jgi:hypothetical protein